MKHLLFALYNNLIVGELVVFVLLLLGWAALAIKSVIKNLFRARRLVQVAP
jgi:hypothetical protein